MSRRSFGSVRVLPSGRFQASYHDPATAERVRAPWTFGSITDARAWLSTVEADSVRGELLDPRLSRRPFAEWAEEWLGGLHLKSKTLVGYESTLRVRVLPVFADRPVAAITYRDCKRFVDELLHAGLAPGTVGEARKVLRLVLQEAVRADAIRRNPADGLRVPRGRRDEMVYLDAEEVLALADAVATPPRSARHAAKQWPAYSLLVRLAAFTGLRAGEVAALRVGRVNPLHGRLQVEESVAEVHGALVYGRPKTYALRAVPIPASLALDLEAHLRTRPPDPDAFVFTAADGGPLGTPTSTGATSSRLSAACRSIRGCGSTTFATPRRRS